MHSLIRPRGQKQLIILKHIIHLFHVCDRLNAIATLRPLSYFTSKYKGPSSMDCRERGSHARGVYTAHDTLRMKKAWVKQEEKADARIIVKEQQKIRNKGTWAGRGKVPKQDPTNAEDLSLELPEGREIPLPQIRLTNQTYNLINSPETY